MVDKDIWMGIRNFLFGGRDTKKPTLSHTVVAAALLASKEIADAWHEDSTGGAPMPPESEFGVRCEMLWFFLVMMHEFAFEAAGRKADALREEVVLNAIRASVGVFFDACEAGQGSDATDWKERRFDEMLEEYNKVVVEYEGCRWKQPGKVGSFSEDTFFGKLGTRIIQKTDQNVLNIGLRLLIQDTATVGMVASRLKQQTEEACGRL